MPRIVNIHHTSFTVSDLDRSIAFFRDALGLELLFVREIREDYFDKIVGLPGARVKAALLRLPGGSHHVELFQYVSPPGHAVKARPCDPGSTHLAFVVEDLAGLHAGLMGKGASFVSAPVPITAGPNRGAFAAYLRDPNGILIELLEPPRRETP
jgi:catechol 2,3-dioxygenase-like lactoylglutathione lyase family enzyme